MPRVLALVVALALFAPAAALAQDTPFGPVPTPEPTIAPLPGTDDVSRQTLYLIAVGVLVVIVVIGVAISKDARRALTPEDRERLEREQRGEKAVPGEVSKQARARARKQRQKVKAARKARRHNR